ncbi:putative hemolysin [Volucribacter psittacicida]|uniref:Putative hemolysin n=1 Tax=Volucribacter psittacicida TaxID=203482 RepID=A0A4R1G253_9PAST|nr:DUF333 domain-containing protein [Volucribacter psittacicida]TCK01774.1 putative hemolysin [Volucribacter psittacicida]
MIKRNFIISLSLILFACGNINQSETVPTMVGIANPASVYCEQQGGKSTISVNEEGSEYGLCILPNGKQVDEWDFYRQQQSIKSFDNKFDVLIIYYDLAKREQVLIAIVQQQAEIVYDYKNFSAFAIKTAQPVKTKKNLQRVEGILQVQFDGKQQLHRNM